MYICWDGLLVLLFPAWPGCYAGLVVVVVVVVPPPGWGLTYLTRQDHSFDEILSSSSSTVISGLG